MAERPAELLFFWTPKHAGYWEDDWRGRVRIDDVLKGEASDGTLQMHIDTTAVGSINELYTGRRVLVGYDFRLGDRFLGSK